MFKRLLIAIAQVKQVTHLKVYYTKYGKLRILCIEQKQLVKKYITI